MKNQPHSNVTFQGKLHFLLKFMNIYARSDEDPTTQEQDISKWKLIFVEIHEQLNKKWWRANYAATIHFKEKYNFCWNSWTSKQEMIKNQPHNNVTFQRKLHILLKFMNIWTRSDEEPTTQQRDIWKKTPLFVNIHEHLSKKWWRCNHTGTWHFKDKYNCCWNAWPAKQEMMTNQTQRNRIFLS